MYVAGATYYYQLTLLNKIAKQALQGQKIDFLSL
jgi:hypothetical protein